MSNITLNKVNLIFIGPNNPNTVCLLPSSKPDKAQKVLIGTIDNGVKCYRMKKNTFQEEWSVK